MQESTDRTNGHRGYRFIDDNANVVKTTQLIRQNYSQNPQNRPPENRPEMRNTPLVSERLLFPLIIVCPENVLCTVSKSIRCNKIISKNKLNLSIRCPSVATVVRVPTISVRKIMHNDLIY